MLVIHIDVQITKYYMLVSMHVISDPFLGKAIYRWSLLHAHPLNVTSLQGTVKIFKILSKKFFSQCTDGTSDSDRLLPVAIFCVVQDGKNLQSLW